MGRVARVVIIGGGPGGYEAALVAAQLGAEVVVVERDGLGGSAVLTDCVPSKTLIATSDVMTSVAESGELGVRLRGAGDVSGGQGDAVGVDLKAVNSRVLDLAQAQSDDVRERLGAEGVELVAGTGRLVSGGTSVSIEPDEGPSRVVDADAVLLATGARPRVVAGAEPDGERILTWTQVYALDELPERLIVVGSGVTGAEFASAYGALGSDVVLVSSRDLVLPGEDPDAAQVIEGVFRRRGMTVLNRSRAGTVARTANGVRVTLTDGRTVDGSHVPDGRRLRPQHRGPRPGRRRSVHRRQGIRRRRPGVAHIDDEACTPPVTAPASSCWRPSPRCRDGSRCVTPSATRSRRWP